MKLGTWFLFAAVFGILFGLAYLIFPGSVLAFFGVSADGAAVLAGRFFGGAVLGFGLLAWLVRGEADSQARTAIVRSLFVTTAIGAVLSVIGVTSGVFNTMGWVGAVVLGLQAIGFGVHTMK